MAKSRRKYAPSPTLDPKGFSYTRRRVIGRGPTHIRLTPSKAVPWWAGEWSQGQALTRQQVETLRALGIDPAGAETIEVRREVPDDRDEPVMLQVGQWKPVYQFACPVVGPGKDPMAVRIIGPNGKPREVREDGWAHEPSTRPYQMAGLHAW